MNLFNDFIQEMISQASIVSYIKFRFKKELSAVDRIIDFNLAENEEEYYNNNVGLMNNLRCACDKKIEENAKKYIEERDLPEWVCKVDMREPEGELIDYCIEARDNGEEVTLKNLQDIVADWESLNDYKYFSYCGLTDDKLKDILLASDIIRDIRKNIELEKTDDKIELLKTTVNLIDNSSSSNIFRQSFINIFSVFDAFMFDVLKNYFYNHPEELDVFFENKNNDKIKATMDDVIKFSSLDELKRDIIQKQFEGRYLSELIYKLHKYKPKLFEKVEFNKIMEMVERRNIHLHNKGYADEKYCKGYNVYNLKNGDYAYIDDSYLIDGVFKLLTEFANDLIKI